MNQAPKPLSMFDRAGNALKAGALLAAVALVALAAHHGNVVPPESTAISAANEAAPAAVAPPAHYLPSQFNEDPKAAASDTAPTF